MGIANIGKKIIGGIGKAGTSRAGLAAVGIGAFGLGVLNKAAPAARDAAMDVAFDDPNADAAFLGRKMSSRFLLGTAMGGPFGAGLQATAPGDYFTANPMGAATAAMGGLAIGTAVAGGGMIKAAYKGGQKGMGIYHANKGIRGSGITGLVKEIGSGIGQGLKTSGKIGMKSLVKGAAFGAAGVGLAALGVRSHIKRNQQFYEESPYAGRTSGSIANAMNASGDIVLGMHNARRGF